MNWHRKMTNNLAGWGRISSDDGGVTFRDDFTQESFKYLLSSCASIEDNFSYNPSLPCSKQKDSNFDYDNEDQWKNFCDDSNIALEI